MRNILDGEEAAMDTVTWIIAAVIIVLLTLWIISTVRGPRRRQHSAHTEDRPPEQLREDQRRLGKGELDGGGGF